MINRSLLGKTEKALQTEETSCTKADIKGISIEQGLGKKDHFKAASEWQKLRQETQGFRIKISKVTVNSSQLLTKIVTFYIL